MTDRTSKVEREEPLRKPNPVVAVAIAASFLTQSCFTVQQVAVPEPDLRSTLSVRGVVLGEGDQSERFEFSEVHDARWTESSLTIIGLVHAPGEADDGQLSTVSFPLSDVSEVLVQELDATRLSVIIMGTIVGASIAIMYLVTGKSKAGVPIGSTG